MGMMGNFHLLYWDLVRGWIEIGCGIFLFWFY